MIFLCSLEQFSVEKNLTRCGIKSTLMSHLHIFPWFHAQKRPRQTLPAGGLKTVIEAINFFLEGKPFPADDIAFLKKLYEDMEASIPIASQCLTTILEVHQQFQAYRDRQRAKPREIFLDHEFPPPGLFNSVVPSDLLDPARWEALDNPVSVLLSHNQGSTNHAPAIHSLKMDIEQQLKNVEEQEDSMNSKRIRAGVPYAPPPPLPPSDL
jgi:hypothetical protein